MPELPEVETVVRGLQGLVGKRIARVVVRHPKLVSVGPKTLSPKRLHTPQQAQAFQRTLKQRRILSIRRSAKLIQFQLSGGWWLLVHLKMAGQIVVQQKGRTQLLVRLLNSPKAPRETMPCKHTHIIVHCTDGTVVYYNDLRLFGTWRAVRESDLAKLTDLSAYGPEPLDPGFTYQHLQRALGRRKNAPIKQALTNQTVLAGVGNIYADEILFAARIRPTRRVRLLHGKEWRQLFTSLQRVLRHAIRTHGSSVGEFIRPNGAVGTYGRYHKVYDRKGKPCVRCATPIVRISLGGRGTHFCPTCQV